MSTFGKVLIVLNLLAAGAFTYVTLENWKARRELTWAATSRHLAVDGLPVEAGAAVDGLGEDRVVFHYTTPDNRVFESIPKKRLEGLVPKGGEKFGGDVVADQTAEIVRLQKKVQSILEAEKANPAVYHQWLAAYLRGLARTGANRDGVNALFLLGGGGARDENRDRGFRRDLPHLARTASQSAALHALADIVDLGDPNAITPDAARESRVAAAKANVAKFLVGEVPHGVKGDGDKAEAERNLKNKVVAATAAGAGEAQKSEMAAAANGDSAGFTLLANVAVEPLTDRASAGRAVDNLLAYAVGKAITPKEKEALAGIKDLISPPLQGFDADKAIEAVALALLNAEFDEAAIPASTKEKPTAQTAGEKSRRIAHVLYHIDAWRYVPATDRQNYREADATDRKLWHERVVAVVGLPAYIRAAESAASEFAEASQRQVTAITEEQSRFEAEYQSQLQTILTLYTEWLALDIQLKTQNAITAENERLRKERETERDELRLDLQASTELAKSTLARLSTTQGKLFTIQRDLRNAQDAILALEKQLRDIELGPDYKRDTTTRKD